jgi:hypothetical protein
LAAGLAVFFGALLLYLATLAPTISWRNDGGDSGELSAAAYLLGVPHPTGYPLFMLLTRPFALLPGGEVALRLNLLDALLGACAATLVTVCAALALRSLPPRAGEPAWTRPVAAALGGAGFALTPLLWSQANLFEVYALNAALVGLTLALALLWRARADGRPRRADRYLSLIGLVSGFALAHHRTAIFTVAAVALFLAMSGQRRQIRPAWALTAALLLAAGALFYLYLPLRALSNPPSNWGDPDTLPRFLTQVLARDYQSYLQPPHSLGELLGAVPNLSRLVLLQFPAPLFVVVFLGVGVLLRDRVLSRTLGFLCVASALFASYYYAKGASVYLLPLVMCLAIWLSAGLYALAGPISAPDVLPQRTLRLAVCLGAPLLVFALLIASADRNSAEFDLAGDWAAHRPVEAIMLAALPASVVYSNVDELTFTLWYLQRVDRRRPDITAIDQRLLALPWYRRQLGLP